MAECSLERAVHLQSHFQADVMLLTYNTIPPFSTTQAKEMWQAWNVYLSVCEKPNVCVCVPIADSATEHPSGHFFQCESFLQICLTRWKRGRKWVDSWCWINNHTRCFCLEGRQVWLNKHILTDDWFTCTGLKGQRWTVFRFVFCFAGHVIVHIMI